MTVLKLLDDDPVASRADLARHLHATVNELAALLDHAPSNWPILVSGDWGSGKTSVLKVLRGELDATAGEGKRKTIWFEAWHYETAAGLLAPLVREVWESAPEEKRKEQAKDLLGRVLRCAAVAGMRALPVMATALGVPFLAAALQGLGIKDIKDDAEAIKPGGKPFPPPDPVRELRSSFAELVGKIWGDERPVIFIDDLDRCTPDAAVALLDAIRLIVAVPNDLRCRFVVALDRSLVVQAITKKFAGIQGFDGNRYLEKIFPVELRVGIGDGRETSEELDALFERTRNMGLALDPDDRDALGAALRDPLFANARLVKRVVNRYLLVRYFEKQLGGRPGGPDPAAQARRNAVLAAWLTGGERWPILRHVMQRQGDEYWDEIAAALVARDERALPGPEAAAMLAEPGLLPWLKRRGLLDVEVRRAFRDAEGRLSRCGL